jgi:hypothetical protein
MGVGALVSETAMASRPADPSLYRGDVPGPFPGLHAGLTLSDRWTVDAVHDPSHGAVAVHLHEGDRTFRLNVLKRDDAGIPGVAQSRSVSVYVCNDGGPTAESEGQAAQALAAWLDQYEANGGHVPSLVTLAEHSR